MASGKFILTAQLKLVAPGNTRQIVAQINRQLQGINANVNIKVNTTSLNNLSATLTNTQKVVKKTTSDIEKFGEQAALAIRRYGAFTLATGGFIKLTQAISAGISEAILFDRELVRVAQVTGQSIKSLQGLSKEVTRLSTEFGVSSSELIKVSVTLAQAGLSVRDVKTALEALAKTGVSATFGDIGNTTEAAIAIFQQFKVEAKDLEGVLGSINKVAAVFAVESDDIAVAVRRAGGAFQAAGGNLNEFISLFTSVRQTTRESAESIATGFRTIFTRLQRTRTQDFFKQFGVELRDLEGQFVGPYEAIQRIGKALRNVQTTDPRFSQVVEELGGFRQVSKVIPLLTQLETQQKALNIAMRGSGSLTEDAAIAQEALAIKINKVKQEFEDLIRTFSNNSTIKAMVDITLALASSIVKLTKSIEPLLPLITAVGAFGISKQLKQFGSGFRSKIFGFASGGFVPGSGSGDTTPAMLTPGEYVINKKSAKAIGYSTLNRINKYANGGIVKGVQNITGNSLASIGLLSALNGVVSAIGGLESNFSKLSLLVASAVFRFSAFNSVIKNSTGAFGTKTKGPFGPGGFVDAFTTIGLGSKSQGLRTFKRIQTGGAIAGTAATFAGEFLSGSANSQIAEGKDARFSSASGQALSGAGIGASIGSIFGPLGIVIGGTVGALGGFVIGLNSATKELDAARFGKKFEEFSNELERFSKGKLATTDISSSITKILSDGVNRFQNTTGDEQKDVISKFKENQQTIEKYFTNIAASSSSMSEFNKRVGDSFVNFAILTKTPFDLLSQSIETQIGLNARLDKALVDSINLRQKEVSQIQNLINIMEGFEAAGQDIQNFSSKLENLFSLLLGGSGLNEVSNRSSDIFRKAKEGQIGVGGIENIRAAGGNISNIAGFGAEKTQQLESTAILFSKLPFIISEFNRQSGQQKLEGGQSEIAISNIASKAGVKNQKVLDQFAQIIDSDFLGEQNNEIKLGSEFGNIPEAAAKIRSSMNSIFDEFAGAQDILEKREALFLKSYTRQAEIEQKKIDIQLEGIQRQEEFVEKIRELNNKPLTFREGLDNLGRKVNTAAGFGGANTNFGSVINTVQARITKLSNDLVTTFDTKTRDDIVSQLSKENAILQRLNKALTILVNDTSALSTGFKELDEISKNNKFLGGAAETALFGTGDEQSKLLKNLLNVQAAKNFGSAFAVPQDDRRELISFLREAGTTGELFGGEQADKLLRRIVTNDVTSAVTFARGSKNAQSPEGREFIETRVDQILDKLTPEQDKLIAKMQAFIDNQQANSNQIVDSLSAAPKTIEEALKSANQAFLNRLELIFIRNQQEENSFDVDANKNQIIELQRILSSIDSLSGGKRLPLEKVLTNATRQSSELKEAANIRDKNNRKRSGLIELESTLFPGNEFLASKKARSNIDSFITRNPDFKEFEDDIRKIVSRGRDLREFRSKVLKGVSTDNPPVAAEGVIGAAGSAISETSGSLRTQASNLDRLVKIIGSEFKSREAVVKALNTLRDSNKPLEKRQAELTDSINKLTGVIDKNLGSGPASALNPENKGGAKPFGLSVGGIPVDAIKQGSPLKPLPSGTKGGKNKRGKSGFAGQGFFSLPPEDLGVTASRNIRESAFQFESRKVDRDIKMMDANAKARINAARASHFPGGVAFGAPLGLVQQQPLAGLPEAPVPNEPKSEKFLAMQEQMKQNKAASAKRRAEIVRGINERSSSRKGLFENPDGSITSIPLDMLRNRRRLSGATRLAAINGGPGPLSRGTTEKFEPSEVSMPPNGGNLKFVGREQAAINFAVKQMDRNSRGKINASRKSGFRGGLNGEIPQNKDKVDLKPLSFINNTINTFVAGFSKIEGIISKMPTEIALTGNHKVEVIINGASVLQNIEPGIRELVKSSIQKSFKNFIDKNNMGGLRVPDEVV